MYVFMLPFTGDVLVSSFIVFICNLLQLLSIAVEAFGFRLLNNYTLLIRDYSV